ncbi:MAG: extensin family protein [Maritimibacter sp.]
MKARALAFVAAAIFIATAARAEAPFLSPRPVHRPDLPTPASNAGLDMAVEAAVVSASLEASAGSVLHSLTPPARPAEVIPVVATSEESATALPVVSPNPAVNPNDPVAGVLDALFGARPPAVLTNASALAVSRSLRPRHRPAGFDRLVRVAATPRAPVSGGSVCGVAAIRGQAIAPIPGPGGCGVDAPVRISSVAGIPLSMQPTIDCPTAIALNDWVRDGVIPTIGRTGGGVARIDIIAHYSCRTRNNQPGAKLSEHSKGHALDVSGVTLRNGKTLTVEDQWSGQYSRVFRTLYRRACGPFGTVLSPDADRYHYNHFHLDTARYRGGPYCH